MGHCAILGKVRSIGQRSRSRSDELWSKKRRHIRESSPSSSSNIYLFQYIWSSLWFFEYNACGHH